MKSMRHNNRRNEQLFASVNFPDGKVLRVYQVISADELKRWVKMVGKGEFYFSNTAQAISAN